MIQIERNTTFISCIHHFWLMGWATECPLSPSLAEKYSRWWQHSVRSMSPSGVGLALLHQGTLPMTSYLGRRRGVSLLQRCLSYQFSLVQSLSRDWLYATPWTAARQASLSITNSRSLLKLMSIESVMPSSHLILCCPLLLLPPIPPSIRVFSNGSTLRISYEAHTNHSRVHCIHIFAVSVSVRVFIIMILTTFRVVSFLLVVGWKIYARTLCTASQLLWTIHPFGLWQMGYWWEKWSQVISTWF